MARIIPTEAPRVVCTKCVRIVRVHWFDLNWADDTMFIAAECCERACGFIDGELVQQYIRDNRAFTTDDITRLPKDHVDEFAARHESSATMHAARAKWARWSL
jgi:hypothetical protein